MAEKVKNGKKITILGAGNVGATIAYTLTTLNTCSEIVLIDINKEKAEGEVMDIRHGLPFCGNIDIHGGEYEDAKDSDIVVITAGIGRKPGQTRIDLAKVNVGLIKQVIPQVAAAAPDAIYVVVSNPVDIITYTILKCTNLSPSQVLGTGTMLDTSRLRSLLADHVDISPQSVHAYVIGEHGDSQVIPWSLTNISGMIMTQYCTHICVNHNECGKKDIKDIEQNVRNAGGEVIKRKGATFYAIAITVARLCEVILTNKKAVLTVSSFMDGSYGLHDVCLSIPCIVSGKGIERKLTPPLMGEEMEALKASSDALKAVIRECDI